MSRRNRRSSRKHALRPTTIRLSDVATLIVDPLAKRTGLKQTRVINALIECGHQALTGHTAAVRGWGDFFAAAEQRATLEAKHRKALLDVPAPKRPPLALTDTKRQPGTERKPIRNAS